MKSRQSENIAIWTADAEERGSKGFVDMCDTWNYDHYPVFFGGKNDEYKTGEEIEAAKNGKNMQRSYGIFKV